MYAKELLLDYYNYPFNTNIKIKGRIIDLKIENKELKIIYIQSKYDKKVPWKIKITKVDEEISDDFIYFGNNKGLFLWAKRI